MKRERLEDLGRIRVMLENLSDNDIFEMYYGRTKDFPEWFREQTSDRQDDILHNVSYGIIEIENKLSECIIIARGHDED